MSPHNTATTSVAGNQSQAAPENSIDLHPSITDSKRPLTSVVERGLHRHQSAAREARSRWRPVEVDIGTSSRSPARKNGEHDGRWGGRNEEEYPMASTVLGRPWSSPRYVRHTNAGGGSASTEMSVCRRKRWRKRSFFLCQHASPRSSCVVN